MLVVSLAALTCCASQPEGLKAMQGLVDFYMENAAILRKTFSDMGFTVYGGTNAPYVWVGFPGTCLYVMCSCSTPVVGPP